MMITAASSRDKQTRHGDGGGRMLLAVRERDVQTGLRGFCRDHPQGRLADCWGDGWAYGALYEYRI
jgi:hypothetical protein